MPLSEGLHFATTLFLSTPTTLHDVWLVQQLPFRDAIANVLRDYGYTEDEIASVETEVHAKLAANPALKDSFKVDALQLASTIQAYDPTSGMHPGANQATAIVQSLRSVAELAHV